MLKYFMLGAAAFALTACGNKDVAQDAPALPEDGAVEAVDVVEKPAAENNDGASGRLAEILARSDRGDDAARDQYRHPAETLAFFGIEPGMTVAETLPGGRGWYTKILVPYLGAEGTLIGVNYSVEHWRNFGGFASPEFLEAQKTWPATFAAGWEERAGAADATVTAFQFSGLPEDMKGTADAVLFFRSLHHLNRFQDKGDFMTPALKDTMDVLKPGGIVAVVQHRGPEENSDAWAVGDNGYLKESLVRQVFADAGFEFVSESDVNANPKDRPTDDDAVWRLLPSLSTSGGEGQEELRAQMEAIGESDRMTLKFRKPTE